MDETIRPSIQAPSPGLTLPVTSTARRLGLGLATSSIALLRLPGAVGHENSVKLLVCVALLAAVASLWPQRAPDAVRGPAALFLALFVAVLVLEVLRGAAVGTFLSGEAALLSCAEYVLFPLLGLALVLSSHTRRDLRDALIAIALAPAAYALVNVVLDLGGIQSLITVDPGAGSIAHGAPAELLSWIGIHTARVQFPLANSINNFGVVTSAGFAAAATLLFRRYGVRRPLAFGAAFFCLYCSLLGDSRGSLFLAALVLAWVAVSPRLRGLGVVPFLVPLLPLLVIAALQLLDASGIADALSRGSSGAESFSTGTGRLFIWDGAWQTLQHFNLQQIVGWGAGGQTTSGAWQHIAYLFEGLLPDPSTAHTHDLAIQTVFDSGYLGLAITTAALGSAMLALGRVHREHPDVPVAPLLAALLVIVLSGATEVTPTIYSEEALLAVLMILGAAAGLSGRPVSSMIR